MCDLYGHKTKKIDRDKVTSRLQDTASGSDAAMALYGGIKHLSHTNDVVNRESDDAWCDHVHAINSTTLPLQEADISHQE